MWLLFHRNAKTKTVRDGHSFVDTCPECRTSRTFHEVEVSESFGLFFVDLIGDKERAYRCGGCGGVFDLRDQPAKPAIAAKPAAAVAATVSREDVERQRAAEAQRRREAAEAKSVQIEDELAALKKRLGR